MNSGVSLCVHVVQAMVHVAHKVGVMHEAGWVHGDLKPSSVIWLPSSNCWTLVNFCCTARVGVPFPATLQCSSRLEPAVGVRLVRSFCCLEVQDCVVDSNAVSLVSICRRDVAVEGRISVCGARGHTGCGGGQGAPSGVGGAGCLGARGVPPVFPLTPRAVLVCFSAAIVWVPV